MFRTTTIAAAACAASLIGAGAAQASFPGGNGRIAYQHFSFATASSISGIYTADSSGKNLQRLTSDFSGATNQDPSDVTYSPSYSPDGRSLLFKRQIGDGRSPSRSEVWVMNADGTGQRRVTASDGITGASFTADGRSILYDGPTTGFEAQAGVWIVGIDGSNPHPLIPGSGDSPEGSPDGTKIAFATAGGIRIAKADGTGAHAVVKGGSDPSWSPDGSRLVYTTSTKDTAAVRTIRADGKGGSTTLVSGKEFAYEDPSYSPDGGTVLFESFDLGASPRRLLTVVPAGGGRPREILARGRGEGNWMGAWQPLPFAPTAPAATAGALAPALRSALRKGGRTLARGRRLRVGFATQAPGSASVTLRSNKRTVLARGTARLRAAGNTRIAVRATRKGRAAFRRHTRKVSLTIKFRAPSGKASTRRASVRVGY